MPLCRWIAGAALASLALGAASATWILRHRAGPGVESMAAMADLSTGPDDADEVVGAAACSACHAKIAAAYAAHPMAHSSGPVQSVGQGPGSLAADDTFVSGRFRYRVEHRGDAVLHHELLVDKAGAVVTDQSASVQ